MQRSFFRFSGRYVEFDSRRLPVHRNVKWTVSAGLRSHCPWSSVNFGAKHLLVFPQGRTNPGQDVDAGFRAVCTALTGRRSRNVFMYYKDTRWTT